MAFFLCSGPQVCTATGSLRAEACHVWWAQGAERRKPQLPTTAREGGGREFCLSADLSGRSVKVSLAPHFRVGNKCENAMCRMLGQVAKGSGFTFPRGRSPTTALLASHTQS